MIKLVRKVRDSVKNLNIYNFNKFMYLAVGIYVGTICLFFFGLDFARKEFCLNYVPMIVLLPVGIIFCFGLWELLDKTLGNSRRIVYYILFLMLSIQMIAVSQYYFYTDWDVTYLIELSQQISHQGNIGEYTEYFSQYPNNLFLAYIYSTLMRLVHLLGYHDMEYLTLLWLQCVLNSLTGLIVFEIICELFNVRKAIWGFVVYCLLVGMSPWVSIPYSDSMGLIVPSLIFLIYVKRTSFRNMFIPWFNMAFLAFVGYKIKPQIVIVFIAIIIISVSTIKKESWSLLVRQCIPGIVAGLIVASIICGLVIKSTGIKVNPDRTFHMQHFLMMGLNTETMGVWSEDDVSYSGWCATSEERNAADLKRAKERAIDLGLKGIMLQYSRKTLTNYYDGTFGWGGEGYFYFRIREDNENVVGQFFRNLYYNREYMGKNYQAWSNFQQMLWVAVLALGVIGIAKKKNATKRKEISVILLSLVGITLFVTLFEARARYIYTYVPFYIIIANVGLVEISCRMELMKEK